MAKDDDWSNLLVGAAQAATAPNAAASTPTSGTTPGPSDSTYTPAQSVVTSALNAPGGPVATAPGSVEAKQAAAQSTADAQGKQIISTLGKAGQAVQSTMGPAAAAVGQAVDNSNSSLAVAGSAATLGGSAKDIAAQKGNADAAMASAKVSATAAQNAAVVNTGAQLGLTGADVATRNQVTNHLLSQLYDTEGKIADMRDVSFSDNPGGWLVNHVISIPWEESRAKSVGEGLGLIGKATDTTQAAVKLQGQITNAANAVESTKTAAIAASQAQSDAALLGIQHQLSALNTQNSAYGTSNQATGVGLEGLGTEQKGAALTGQLSVEQQGVATKAIQQGFTSTEAQTQIDELSQRTKNLSESLDKMSQGVDNLDLVKQTADGLYKSLGFPQGSPGIQAIRLMPAAQRQAMFSLAASMGSTGTAENGGLDGMLAADPGEAYRNLTKSKLPLTNLPVGQQTAISHLGELYQQGILDAHSPASEAIIGGKVAQGSDLEKSIVDGYVKKRLLDESSVIPSDGPGNKNIFATPSLNVLSTSKDSSGKMLGDSNPVLKQMQPLLANGAGQQVTHPSDFNEILQTAASLSGKGGTLSSVQAAKAVQDIVQTARDTTDSTLGLKRFAIPHPDGYKVQIRGSQLGQSQIFDLSNPAQIQAAMAYAESSRRVQQMQGGFGGGTATPGGY